MAKTIRERALEALVAKFAEMEIGEPVADPYSVTWEIITREDLGAYGGLKSAALGVFDGREDKVPDVQHMRCTLQMNIQFRIIIEVDESADTRMNEVLGDLQRKFREDIQLGGLALNLEETGNELDIEGPNAKQATGVLFISLKYRHRINDPRQQ